MRCRAPRLGAMSDRPNFGIRIFTPEMMPLTTSWLPAYRRTSTRARAKTRPCRLSRARSSSPAVDEMAIPKIGVASFPHSIPPHPNFVQATAPGQPATTGSQINPAAPALANFARFSAGFSRVSTSFPCSALRSSARVAPRNRSRCDSPVTPSGEVLVDH